MVRPRALLSSSPSEFVADAALLCAQVTKVDEPSKYGVVLTVPGQSTIDRFVEKPKEYVGNRINAGIYIFNPSVLNRIEVKPTSIESEVFPAMAKDRQLHSMDLEGFWMDIGQPKGAFTLSCALSPVRVGYEAEAAGRWARLFAPLEPPVARLLASGARVLTLRYHTDYLTGTCLYLSYLTACKSTELADPAKHEAVTAGNVIIHPSAKVDPSASIGPNVVVGPNCTVGKGARLQRCVLLDGARIKDHAFVQSSIIGWSSTVGKWARVEGTTVLGDDVNIKDEVFINGASVLPHKSVSNSILEPSIVMVRPAFPRPLPISLSFAVRTLRRLRRWCSSRRRALDKEGEPVEELELTEIRSLLARSEKPAPPHHLFVLSSCDLRAFPCVHVVPRPLVEVA